MKLLQFTQLVLTKVQLNLKSEAQQSYLSYIWWLLEPALFVGVFYLVFGVFLARGTDDFLIFLLCGQVPFLWFARTLGNSAASIEQGRGLMQQIRIPKVFFPCVTILQDFVKALCVFVLFFIFLVFYGLEVTYHWIALPLIILVQLVLICGLSIMISMIVPFIPDFKFLVNTGLQLIMFGSGIFYEYKDVLLEEHQNIFLMNPMASLINQFRVVLIDNQWPDLMSLFFVLLGSLVLIMVSLLALRKLDAQYPKLLAE